MVFREFYKKQLKKFVLSGDYKKYNVLSITRQRAISQIRNPLVQENDTLLIIAFNEKNEIIKRALIALPGIFIIDFLFIYI